MKRITAAALAVLVLAPVPALGAIRCPPSVFHSHWRATCPDSVDVVLTALPAEWTLTSFGESAGSVFDVVLDFGNGQACRRTITARFGEAVRFDARRWQGVTAIRLVWVSGEPVVDVLIFYQ